MMTEEQARAKTCCGPPAVAISTLDGRCLASECMAWRWGVTPEEASRTSRDAEGYCGLAAKQILRGSEVHASDCAIYNEPALPAGPCDCGVERRKKEVVQSVMKGVYTMSDLHALAERIETAAGPDREIDAALEAWAYELDNDAQADIVCDSDNAERGHYWVSIDGGRTLYSSAPLTSSLDAAVALCERALPECWWEIEREFVYDKGELRERYTGRVRRSRDAFMHVYGAPTPALALCLAVVRAKIAATPETPASAAETGEDRG